MDEFTAMLERTRRAAARTPEEKRAADRRRREEMEPVQALASDPGLTAVADALQNMVVEVRALREEAAAVRVWLEDSRNIVRRVPRPTDHTVI